MSPFRGFCMACLALGDSFHTPPLSVPLDREVWTWGVVVVGCIARDKSRSSEGKLNLLVDVEI
jgi:hypothetical protein